MDYPSRNILTAAIVEKRELVQMLYDQGRQDEGLNEYMELRRLGALLRKVVNGDPRTDNQGTGEDSPTE